MLQANDFTKVFIWIVQRSGMCMFWVLPRCSNKAPCAWLVVGVAPGCLDSWDVELQKEASLSAHLYSHSLHPDTVQLSFIPLDFPSCLSGLGFVMSGLMSERDLRTQETHTTDTPYRESRPTLSSSTKIPFTWKIEVTQAPWIIRLQSPCVGTVLLQVNAIFANKMKNLCPSLLLP